MNAQTTLSHTFYVDEVATDATGNVTYTVKRLDGTLIVTGTATHGTTGVYSFTLAPVTSLDTYVVTWTCTLAGGAVAPFDYLEIVGGTIFSLAQLRNAKPALSVSSYSTADLIAARLETEVEAERILGRALFPKFGRYALDGNNDSELLLPIAYTRVLRSVTIIQNGVVTVSVPNISANSNIWLSASGVVQWWGGWFPYGRQNIIFELEHGMDFCPPTISSVAIIRARTLIGQTDTSVPYRAISYSVHDGGTYRLSTPSCELVGIPTVDAVYQREATTSTGFA
jgi:hypothetical protein